MGYPLYREVKRHAPDDLDTGELALLLILADEANDQTRECFPGMDELCAYMRMSAVGVRKILQRLAQRGIDVRVPVAKDSTGRVVYAVKGARTTYRLPRFAPTGPTDGDTQVSPKSPQRRSAGIADSGVRGDGGIAIDAQRRSAGTSMAIPQDRPSPHVPHEEEDPHLLPSQRILRSAGITLGDEEEKRFIDWINKDNRKGTPWWRTVAKNGDLPDLVAQWRAALAPAAPGTGGLPPWCGYCGDGGDAARTNARFRRKNGEECPDCHPDAAGPRQQPTGTATGRALAQADAAGEEAKRIIAAASGHQPHRNPTDQSVYLKGIA